jgi:anthranilate synthase component 1
VEIEEFIATARANPGSMVPVSRELLEDTLTPVVALLRLRARSRSAFLLESVEGGERIGRYSFLGMDPFARISASGDRVTWEGWGGASGPEAEGNFFDVCRRAMEIYRAVPVKGIPPFAGGAVGYIGYDAIRYIEKIPDRHPREEGCLPDAAFNFYDTVVAFDRARHRLVLIAQVHAPSGGREPLDLLYREAQFRLDRLEDALLHPVPGEEAAGRIDPLPPAPILEGMRSNFSQEDFEAAVAKAKDHIAAGDAFQIVLSQEFRRRTDVDPFQVYRVLRALNPSPYLFYLTWDDTALVGSSPEILVKVEGRKVTVRPIAGTRPRSPDADEDRRREADLLADEKELAEHRMLVDLGRNDVGRVARFGSVRVPRLLEIERYSHVLHIVSQVEGELREDLGPLDAFCAGFPAGTVSGAPKIRAMEIIDDLERSRRGIYAGAVGYLDFAGNLDTCIAIRTLLFHRGEARLQAGAGIVADSVPEREYQETIHKASALYEAIRRAEAISRPRFPGGPRWTPKGEGGGRGGGPSGGGRRGTVEGGRP